MQEKTKFFIQYYSIHFLKNFLFLKTYIILLLTNNLSVKQVSSVLSIYGIVSLLIQIPNGVLSDRLGYKRSIMGVMSLLILGYLTIFISKSFWSFCLFYACYGLYETIFASAKESLFYNNMKHLNLVKNFSQYKNISRIMSFTALTTSAFISGKFINENINLVLKIDIIILLMDIFMIVWTKEHRKDSMKKLNNNYFKSLKNGFHYILRHKTLLKLLIFQTIWYPLSRVFIGFCPLIYREISPVVSQKFTMNIMVSVQIIFVITLQTLLVSKLSKKSIYIKNGLFVMGAFCALLSLCFYSGLPGYLFNILYLFFTQFADVLTIATLLDLIPMKSKACIMSIASFFSSIIKLAIFNIIGNISKIYNYRMAFIVIFFIYFICCVIFFITLLTDKHIKKIQNKYVNKN